MFRLAAFLVLASIACAADTRQQRYSHLFNNGYNYLIPSYSQHSQQVKAYSPSFYGQQYRPQYQAYQHGQYLPSYSKYFGHSYQYPLAYQQKQYHQQAASHYNNKKQSTRATTTAQQIQAALQHFNIEIPENTVVLISGNNADNPVAVHPIAPQTGPTVTVQQTHSQQHQLSNKNPASTRGTQAECESANRVWVVGGQGEVGICGPCKEGYEENENNECVFQGFLAFPSAALAQIFGAGGVSSQQLFGKDPAAAAGNLQQTNQIFGIAPGNLQGAQVQGAPQLPSNIPFLSTGSANLFTPVQVSGQSLQSAVPALVPQDVLQNLNKPINKPQNIVEPGTTVGLAGKNPSGQYEICATNAEGQKDCKVTTHACGSTQSGAENCISITNLATTNPLSNQANEVFQAGIQQLGDQLFGREPEKNSITRQGGAASRGLYWEYRIYYHVSDQEAGLWMGHVQIYLGAYEWTLGLYYYIDPNGDLRLTYYSVTPADGYIAEVAVWPGFVPYAWQDEDALKQRARFQHRPYPQIKN